MKSLIKNRILHIVLILILGIILGALLFNSSQQTQVAEHSEDTEWTCSMHPQIRQNEPGKCPLCGMDLIPVSTQSSGSANPFIHTMSAEAVALAQVQTTKVSFAASSITTHLTGKIAVNEQKLSVITANYSGRIEKLFVDYEGQQLNKGQKLATIYSPELITAQQELLEASRYKDANPYLYNAVKERLRLWQISDAQINSIEKSGKVIPELDIYTENFGTVLKRLVSQGDYVDKGTVLFEIADLSKLWVVLDVYESDVHLLRTGQEVKFTLVAIPGKEFSSTVSFVSPLIDARTRTATVRAEIDSADLSLKPEMFVNAQIIAKLPDNALVIPKSAVLWTGRKSVVYVKVPDSEFPAFEMREVTLGVSTGDHYTVQSGLKDNEEIVTNGVFAIDAAAQLHGKFSMMSRPVSKRLAAPDTFKKQLTDLVNQYFKINESLVDSDFSSSGKAAQGFLSALNSVDMNLLEHNPHIVWMEKENLLRSYATLLAAAKDIEEQRVHFSPLSDTLIDVAETFGLLIDSVFVSYCPMAFDDEGAYWLSESEEILNPYFGDMMLRCGEVRKTISAEDSYQETPVERPADAFHQH